MLVVTAILQSYLDFETLSRLALLVGVIKTNAVFSFKTFPQSTFHQNCRSFRITGHKIHNNTSQKRNFSVLSDMIVSQKYLNLKQR